MSERGGRWQELGEGLREQDRQMCHVLAHMTEARQAAYTGLLAPSLLPRHTEAEEDRPWPHTL
jgi:hypothetical protein